MTGENCQLPILHEALYSHFSYMKGVCFLHSIRNERFRDVKKCTHQTADSGEIETHTSQGFQSLGSYTGKHQGRQGDKVKSREEEPKDDALWAAELACLLPCPSIYCPHAFLANCLTNPLPFII